MKETGSKKIKSIVQVLAQSQNGQEIDEVVFRREEYDVDGRQVMVEQCDVDGQRIEKNEYFYKNGFLVREISTSENKSVEIEYSYQNNLLVVQVEKLSAEDYLETSYSYNAKEELIGSVEKDGTGKVYSREVIKGDALKTTIDLYFEEELYETDIFHYDERGNEIRQINIKYAPDEEILEAQEVKTETFREYDSQDREISLKVERSEKIVYQSQTRFDSNGNLILVEYMDAEDDFDTRIERTYNLESQVTQEKIFQNNELMQTSIFSYNLNGDKVKIAISQKTESDAMFRYEYRYSYTYF